MQFSEIAIARFRAPRYRGFDFEPDGVAMTGKFETGRWAIIALKSEGGVITGAGFRTFNCISSVASADWACEWSQGKTPAELVKLEVESILEALEGLPLSRQFCAHLVRDALVAAARKLGTQTTLRKENR